MASRLLIRTIPLANGEYLPLPVERASGIPLYPPTLVILAEARQRNRAAATILRTRRELVVLLNARFNSTVSSSLKPVVNHTVTRLQWHKEKRE